jgi:hypothetical protein
MKKLLLLPLLLLFTNCSKYQGLGKLQTSNRIFVADVTHYWYGGASIDFKEEKRNVSCYGKALLTEPKLSCAGQKGTFHASCSDKTILEGIWVSTSCFSGIGKGRDNKGEPFNFNFGYSPEKSRELINQ